MTISVLSFGRRNVYCCTDKNAVSINFSSEFVVLVPIFFQEDINEAIKIISPLLGKGCKEVCCVGLESEIFHDLLDDIIEDSSFFDVVTTWHKDVIEGCEYFLFAAGGQKTELLVFTFKHPEILSFLADVDEL